MIEVVLTIPEGLAASIQSGENGQNGRDLSRRLLEMAALEGFKSGQLTSAQLQQMLGFESRFDVDGFLKERGVFFDYSSEELAHEEETSQRLFATRAKSQW